MEHEFLRLHWIIMMFFNILPSQCWLVQWKSRHDRTTRWLREQRSGCPTCCITSLSSHQKYFIIVHPTDMPYPLWKGFKIHLDTLEISILWFKEHKNFEKVNFASLCFILPPFLNRFIPGITWLPDTGDRVQNAAGVLKVITTTGHELVLCVGVSPSWSNIRQPTVLYLARAGKWNVELSGTTTNLRNTTRQQYS